MSLPILWVRFELSALSNLVNYNRLTRTLERINKILIVYFALRIASAIIEYTFAFGTGYLTILINGAFFSVLSLVLRWRRQKLADEWKNIPPDTNVYNDIEHILQTTTKENIKVK